GSLNSGSLDWYRLYVTNVSVRKTHKGESDPLSMSYGGQLQTGVQFKVYVSPHKINGQGISNGGQLSSIQTVFKYRSGRKNILNASAGNYQTYQDPIVFSTNELVQVGLISECGLPSFLRPVINATATR